MGLHLAGQVGAGGLQIGLVHRHADSAAGGWGVRHIEHPPLAGHHRRGAGAPHGALGPRLRCGVPGGLFKKFDLPGDRVRGVARLHGAHVGVVDPGKPPVGVAHPHRVRQRVEHRPQGDAVQHRAAVALPQLGEFEAFARNVADAQHGAAADGAALGFQMAVRSGDKGHAEALARGAQALDAGFHLAGGFRRQPCAEGEHATPRARVADKGGVAPHVRLRVGAAPGDQDLRFGGQKRVGAVQIGAG